MLKKVTKNTDVFEFLLYTKLPPVLLGEDVDVELQSALATLHKLQASTITTFHQKLASFKSSVLAHYAIPEKKFSDRTLRNREISEVVMLMFRVLQDHCPFLTESEVEKVVERERTLRHYHLKKFKVHGLYPDIKEKHKTILAIWEDA